MESNTNHQLQAEVENLDSVPESQHFMYTKNEENDSYILNPEVQNLVKNSESLYSLVGKLREEKKHAEKASKENWTKLKTLEEEKQMSNKQEEKPGDDRFEIFQKQIQDMAEKMKRSEEITRNATIGEAVSKVGAKYQAGELVSNLMKQKLTVSEENGKMEVRVLNDANEIRYRPDGVTPMTADDLAQEWMQNPEYAVGFKSTKAGGAGINPPKPVRPVARPSEVDINDTRAVFKFLQGGGKLSDLTK